MSSDEEEYRSGASSACDNPVQSHVVYRRSYFPIVKEFFGVDFEKRSSEFVPPGLDHDKFKSEAQKLISSNNWDSNGDGMSAVYTHTICNQYATASGSLLRSWEAHDQMKDHYDGGRLPKLCCGSSSSRNVSLQPDFLDGLSDDGSTEEEQAEKADEKILRVDTFLDGLNVGTLLDVARMTETVMQRMWLNKKKVEALECYTKDKAYVVYEYPDNEETREMMTQSLKLGLYKLAIIAGKRSADNLLATPPSKKARVASPLPQEDKRSVPGSVGPAVVSTAVDGGSYAPGFNFGGNKSSGYLGGGENESDRVYWGDVLQEVGVEDMLVGIPNADDVLKEVKMVCGRNFVKRYNGPDRNVVSGRREYTQDHKNNMLLVAEDVKKTVVQNLKRT